ncbi:E3 ubiquitin/ISG15 ligase TRIM25-like [Takifugu flavidus]|uniref:E3 ubiquitin/ISG15 ligase TRIM25-like n=1 Tax=Takifugu flavidus TaxID=433684 RepID=UPI002544C28D|nr:E3 ubiquitin/ISG15 ligase TRIM25-like [Takifugu flavidus]
MSKTTEEKEKDCLNLAASTVYIMPFTKPVEHLANELSCPICFQLFCDPVVLPCGHNYCRTCIWTTASPASKSGQTPPCCPECRGKFQDVESLQKNFKLCNIVEGFRASAPHLERHFHTESEKMEVFCDHCIDEPSVAVKSCLKCEVLLCSRHLQKHQEKESFRSHLLVEPLSELGMKSCTCHHRPLEYFCSSDMNLLCATCFIEGHHQNHDILTFTAAEEEMRRALQSRCKVVSSRLQMIESLFQKMAEDQGASEATSDKMANKAITLMDSIAALVERYRERLHDLLEEEGSQYRKSWQLGLSSLEQQQHHLMDAQNTAKQVLMETDTCIFIRRFLLIDEKMREVITSNSSSQIPPKNPFNAKHLQASLKTQDFRLEMTHLLDSLHILLNPMELTFNLCTAHPSLLVSNDLHTVKYTPTKQLYPEHPERFTSAPQILCTKGFSGGEHIWVVEVGANAMWSLGICYKSIPRCGDHSRLGHNSVSWRLQWKNSKLTVCQSSCNVALGEVKNHPQRVEIALDYEGGVLTFHSTKGHREHLYTFRTVFREPVYPAFSIHSNTPDSWISLQSEL